MLQQIKENDVVIASRNIKGGQSKAGLYSVILFQKAVLCIHVWCFTVRKRFNRGIQYVDTQSAYAINLDKIVSRGYYSR
jgi:hypothetical protein